MEKTTSERLPLDDKDVLGDAERGIGPSNYVWDGYAQEVFWGGCWESILTGETVLRWIKALTGAPADDATDKLIYLQN